MTRPVACLGDVHVCPVHGPNVVAEGGSAMQDGRPIARLGDKCACGCVILEGSTGALLDGRPVAMLGARTTLGGVITACAGLATVR